MKAMRGYSSEAYWSQLAPRLRSAVLIVICFIATSIIGAQDDRVDADEALPPLQVWLPAPLISDESGDAFQLLSEHTAAFTSSNAIAIVFRIKDVGKVGGILSTIRAGKDVAPAALPDVTLIRRRDFTPAQARQYLQSMETMFSTSLINDLDDGLDFGQISLEDGSALYGLPYLFDVLLAIQSQPLETSGYRLTFDDVINNRATFLFPAARTNGLNQTFYMQYLSAGGRTPSDGVMSVDEEALGAVLKFYEVLVNLGLVAPEVLTFQSPAAYQSEFISQSDRPRLAIFSASDYLAMIDQQDATLTAAKAPTLSGAGRSIRDGWLWVLVTPDMSRQALAARYLEWMMEPDFHADIARALYHLPTQPALLDDSLPPTVDRQFFVELLDDATLPLPENEGGTAPRLMQEALIDVLHGDATAAQATRQVLNQLAER
ncbi:MAG: hypothetical protein OXI77_06245 [Chloroflexota bacterium]|nr:hypothetical protein [Chloroflexota bacterium]MDE2909809.1 hypothetical protein [Chloroflexota bacterium]